MKLLIFGADVNFLGSANIWQHWKRTFQSYLRRIARATFENKLDILIISLQAIYQFYVSERRTFDEDFILLGSPYVKRVDEVFARRRLNTSPQKSEKSLEEFFYRLKRTCVDSN